METGGTLDYGFVWRPVPRQNLEGPKSKGSR